MSNIPNNVLVDDEDRPMLEEMGKWYISNNGYCVKISSRKLGKRKTLQMHRIIMRPSEDMVIDHINGNPLDNRRCNLRIVTSQQNSFNRTTSKGYCWDDKRNKWKAGIKINSKSIHLGYFHTEAEAREAYISAKQIHHNIVNN